MKLQKMAFVLTVALSLLSAKAYSQTGEPKKSSSSPSTPSVEAFLGRWDLTLKAPDREYPYWLELRQDGGQLRRRWWAVGETHDRFPKLRCQMAASLSFLRKRRRAGPTIWFSKECWLGRRCRELRPDQMEPPGNGPARER